MNKRFLSIFLSVILIVAFCVSNGKVFAYNEFYSSNDVLFYDKNATDCATSNPSSNITSSGYERLKETVRTYGEVAMNLQREYGTPWEIVFAQMQKESSTGTAGIAVAGATNNWLGITGEGNNGSWISGNGRRWAKYSDVGASIKDWAGPRVLRSGYYDDAFKYLDPNNYNITAFLTEMLSSYAPNSDGNNEEAYRNDVLGFINGPIASVRAEKGWMSSADLAKSEGIVIGGKNPIGTSIQSTTTQTTNNNCSSLKSGGIASQDQAQDFMKIYENSSDSINYLFNASKNCIGGALSNCVSFSTYFINKYTNSKAGSSLSGDGKNLVSNLLALNPGMQFGDEPKPYAIFSQPGSSTNQYGHTGVILGVDLINNKVIVGEASCSSTAKGGSIKIETLDSMKNHWGQGTPKYAYPNMKEGL